ncbi:peptide/nickel transport system substrate-binding protein [Rhodococcus sp. 27YEA15]|uniref:ABC transporter substrate-binding protein n=1 Tax=Rhodococcus sp. 27YEA15 TaxID=3156259 RepID=UPI003C7CF541
MALSRWRPVRRRADSTRRCIRREMMRPGNRLLFDTLVRRAPEGKVVPGLSSSWEQLTPTEYVFTIGEGATCADGTPITADVIANSLSYLSDPETGATLRNVIFGSSKVTVAADASESAVRISLDEPWSGLVNGLSLPQSGIICPAGLADPKGLHAGTVEAGYSGPYVLKEVTPGVRYIYELREDYDAWPEFARNLPGEPPSKLDYGVLSDTSAIQNRLLSGDLDVGYLTYATVDRFESRDDFSVVAVSLAVDSLVFNQRESSPFKDRDLRLAVVHALDRTGLTDSVTNGRGKPADSFVISTIGCGNDDSSIIPEFEGSKNAKALEGVNIRIVAGPGSSKASEYVQSTLNELGANVTLDSLDNTAAQTRFNTQPNSWDIIIPNIQNPAGTMAGPLSFVLGAPREAGGSNYSGATNATAIDFFHQAQNETDLVKQCELFEEAEAAVIKDVDTIPLQEYKSYAALRSGLSLVDIPGYRDPSLYRIDK